MLVMLASKDCEPDTGRASPCALLAPLLRRRRAFLLHVALSALSATHMHAANAKSCVTAAAAAAAARPCAATAAARPQNVD